VNYSDNSKDGRNKGSNYFLDGSALGLICYGVWKVRTIDAHYIFWIVNVYRCVLGNLGMR